MPSLGKEPLELAVPDKGGTTGRGSLCCALSGLGFFFPWLPQGVALGFLVPALQAEDLGRLVPAFQAEERRRGDTQNLDAILG